MKDLTIKGNILFRVGIWVSCWIELIEVVGGIISFGFLDVNWSINFLGWSLTVASKHRKQQ